MRTRGKQDRRRLVWAETLEARELLAVDLAVSVDPVSDATTRTVRVFNNGDSIARDAVIQLDLSAAFDHASWSRRPGTAQVRHQENLEHGSAHPGFRRLPSRTTTLGDINQDGHADYLFPGDFWLNEDSLLVRGREGLELEAVQSATLDELVAKEETWTLPCGSAIELPGDINQDGFQDFALSCYPNPVILYGGPQNLVIGEPLKISKIESILPPGWTPQRFVHSGDFNGDGSVDILFEFYGPPTDDTASGKGLVEVVSGAHLLLGRSDLSDFPVLDPQEMGVMLAVRTNLVTGGSKVAARDVNADGVVDVVLAKVRSPGGEDAERRQIVVLGGNHLQSAYYGDFLADELNGENGYVIRKGRSSTSTPSPLLEGHGDVLHQVTISPGDSVVYTVHGNPIPAGKIQASASVSIRTDRDPSNNSFNTAAATQLVLAAEHDELVVGESVTFNVEIANVGENVANTVEVVESISATLDDASWTLETTQLYPDTIQAFDPVFGPGKVGFELRDYDGSQINVNGPIPWYLSKHAYGLGEHLGVLGDINGDGIQDFHADTGVFLGDPTLVSAGFDEYGGKVKPWWRSNESERYRIANALGDIDGDGFDDFLLEVRLNPRRLPVYQIIHGRADVASNDVSPEDSRNRRVKRLLRRAGDVNNDGKDDLIDDSGIILGGSFELIATDSSEPLRRIGDVNNDGFDDLIATGATESHVILGRSEWNDLLTVAALPELEQPLGKLVPDLNGDGFDDFISHKRDGLWGTPVQVEVVLGAADLLSDDLQLVRFDLPQGGYETPEIEVADWNGGGFGDMAVFSTAETIEIYFGSENLFADEPQLVIKGYCTEHASCPHIEKGIDINQDGVDDLLVGNPGQPPETEFSSAGAFLFVLGRTPTMQSGKGEISKTFDVRPQETLTLQVTGIVTPATRRQSHEIVAHLRPEQFNLNPFTSQVKLAAVDPLLGDLDQDGTVGFADFLTLSRYFGSDNATSEQGDLDDDGRVSYADFVVLSNVFGKS